MIYLNQLKSVVKHHEMTDDTAIFVEIDGKVYELCNIRNPDNYDGNIVFGELSRVSGLDPQ